MKVTMARSTTTRRPARPMRHDVIGRIEAVVIDEHRQPVEQVPGIRALKASGQELALNADLPLLPGSHLLVQFGDRHAPGAARLRLEVEVVGCKKWMTGHEVRTRLVEGTMPRELLLKAA